MTYGSTVYVCYYVCIYVCLYVCFEFPTEKKDYCWLGGLLSYMWAWLHELWATDILVIRIM